ncbi:MAG: hemolysin family protein [Chloroflexi bacterium]|nr:hemolysin family protein [Chloroflexota bacterium]
MTDSLAVVIPVSIVALLIALNGLFVAAEFAIVGAPRAAIAARAARGERVARLVNSVLTEPRNQDRYIATAQLGITFATLGLGMYGEHHLAHWIEGQLDGWSAFPAWLAAHTMATVIAITVMTYFHVVIGEMVPKALALEHAEGTALRVTPPMLWLRRLLFPLVVGLNAIGNGLLKLIGIDRAAGSEEQYYSTEELEFVVQESLKGGLLGDGSGQILRELFDLGGLVAEDVMTPRVQVEGLRVGTPPEDLQRLLAEHAHTRYPIYGEDMDDIQGVVHVRRIAELVESWQPLDRDGVREVPFVPDSTPLSSVVKRMRAQEVQFAVVIDEHGGTAGIITPDDITDEVLGRIPEGDAPAEMFRDAAGRFHAAGTVRLDELSERLQVQLEHPEAETVSGLVLAVLERPPHVGDVVAYDDVELRVVQVQGLGVSQVIATPLVPPLRD